MAKDEQPPDWSLLPHNPIAFFGLSKGFDRKALKRKYSKLIRQFKPEKFPAEFQKIRAAYELLDGQLRYGESTTSVPQNQFQWEAVQSEPIPVATPIEPPSLDAGADSHPIAELAEIEVPIYQRIETEPIQQIYDEYKNRIGKSPYDYFVMSLLADVTSDDPLMFFKLVLTGIQKHRDEQGLMNLLYEYLQQEMEPKQIPAVLKTLSKVVQDQQFYFLTEKLWDSLLRKVDFSTWSRLLSACESNLKDFRIEGQIAFYIHVLPTAIFKADGSWLKQKLGFLEDNGSEIPDVLDADLELVYQLLDYRKSLVDDASHSKVIHNAIWEFFMLGGREGDEAVINVQLAFAQNPGHLLNNYSLDTPYNNAQISIWNYINDDVCQRHGLVSHIDPQALRAKIFDLMDDLNRSELSAFGWKENMRYHWTRMGPYSIAFVTPFILASAWFNVVSFVLALVLAIAGVLLVKFWYRPSDRFDVYIEKRMRRRYLYDWRSRFVHLFEATQTPHHELSDALIEIVEQHSEKVGFAAWLCRFFPADLGLHLFALSARFLR